MLSDLLRSLGLSEKEEVVYETLARMGVQPASVLARRLQFDRVVTYKYLKKLALQGLVKIYLRDGIQYFCVTGAEGIGAYIEEQSAALEALNAHLPAVDQELRQLMRGEGFVPTVQIFEGKSGIRSLFRDILFEAAQENVLRIRMLTSNTFDQQMGSMRLSQFMDEFFLEAKKRALGIEIVEASGTLLPEYVRRIDPRHFAPEHFPAARGATNVFLVGTALYLACYDDSQIGLKIKQQQMSQIFHFFFDMVCRTAPPPDLRPPNALKEWMRSKKKS